MHGTLKETTGDISQSSQVSTLSFVAVLITVMSMTIMMLYIILLEHIFGILLINLQTLDQILTY